MQFQQIEAGAALVPDGIQLSITGGGAVTGRGVGKNPKAIGVCAGKLQGILRSFGAGEEDDEISGGAEGGDVAHNSARVVSHGSKLASSVAGDLDARGKQLAQLSSDLESVASLAQLAAESSLANGGDAKDALLAIADYVRNGAGRVRAAASGTGPALSNAQTLLERNEHFLHMIAKLGKDKSAEGAATMLSLSFASVNELHALAKQVREALDTTKLSTQNFFGSTLEELEGKLDHALSQQSGASKESTREFLKAWATLLKAHGFKSGLRKYVKGGGAQISGGADGEGGATIASKTRTFAERIANSRVELGDTVSRFCSAFGANLATISHEANNLADLFGKSIDFNDKAAVFIETFARLGQYVEDRQVKMFQHLLEINSDEDGSREIKQRFLAALNDVAARANDWTGHEAGRALAKACTDAIATVDKFNSAIKTQRETIRTTGGASNMDDLFTISTTPLNVSGLVDGFEQLRATIRKMEFFRNVALFRANIQKTGVELELHSKDYHKNVGKTIADTIAKINREHDVAMRQLDDESSGLGLEISMHNSTASKDDKMISKEQIRQIYTWRRDARVGLYKTVEAIDLYLLHFTEAATKNPDALIDIHQMLTATRIIAKWYDDKAADNIVRMFESMDPGVNVDSANFIKNYRSKTTPCAQFADIARMVSGEEAAKLYQRCRRAVEGIVVLKNIISYFMTVGEKYSTGLSKEKHIFMGPKDIYKNLTTYVWVSALELDMSGTEYVTDKGKTKQVFSFSNTQLKFALCPNINPDKVGMRGNSNSIVKLRILKSINDLGHLRNSTGALGRGDSNTARFKNFIANVFARLKQSSLIGHMATIGVYDLSSIDDAEDLKKMMTNIQTCIGPFSIRFPGQAYAPYTNRDVRTILAMQRKDRNKVTLRVSNGSPSVDYDLISVDELVNTAADLPAITNSTQIAANTGLTAFFLGFLGSNQVSGVDAADQVFTMLRNALVRMLDYHNKENHSSPFAIDDAYFVLVIKAMAGKIMAVTGVSRILKDPKTHKTSLGSQSRIILGGADTGEVIEGAVELYVRLPLLLEFYRHLFDDGNSEFKQENMKTNADHEQIAFVPEIGNVWSRLVTNIFDKSKHINSGIYTTQNMRNIVTEINAIYTHYQGPVKDDMLVPHVMSELVAEINRRYGVIKREQLQQYYRAVNQAKRTTDVLSSINYAANDLDVFEAFEDVKATAPSDEFLKLSESVNASTTPSEKFNKLTDYKIVKDFREKLSGILTQIGTPAVSGSLVSRIRMLKQLVKSTPNREDKYDVIIKAIEETDAPDQASANVFGCFHELVIMPLRTLSGLSKALEWFLFSVFSIIGVAKNDPNAPPPPALLTKDNNGKTLIERIIDAIAATKPGMRGVPTNLLFASSAATVSLNNATGGPYAFARENFEEGLTGSYQIMLMNTLVQFASNSNGLVRMTVSANKSINIDFSAYQQVCERLLSDVKHMVDKFTGLVPSALLDQALNSSAPDTVYSIEKKLIQGIFNKLDKSESSRGVMCIDTLYQVMPAVSAIIFKSKITAKSVAKQFSLQSPRMRPIVTPVDVNYYENNSGAANIDAVLTNRYVQDVVAPFKLVVAQDAMPFIRDAFMVFSPASKMFVSDSTSRALISPLLFNPAASAVVGDSGANKFAAGGIIQQYNNLIAQYLHSIYDAQSRKIYTKAFASFSGSALVEAISGDCFPDFGTFSGHGAHNKLVELANVSKPDGPSWAAFLAGGPATRTHVEKLVACNHYDLPRGQTVLSATLAYALKTMTTRVNPMTGTKIHEIASLKNLSPHMLERYRAAIPTFARIITIFLNRLRLQRKIISQIKIANDPASVITQTNTITFNAETLVRETDADTAIPFATPMPSVLASQSAASATEVTCSYIDAIVSGASALLQDVKNIQAEMDATDSVVPIFFDLKQNFTKNHLAMNGDLPFAPVSILSASFSRLTDNLVPLPGATRPAASTKFMYGLRSLLPNDFALSTEKLPYANKIIADFNGLGGAQNHIDAGKYNEMLGTLGKALSFYNDLRFYNGSTFDLFDFVNQYVVGTPPALTTYQESQSGSTALAVIESIGTSDGRATIGAFVKQQSAVVTGPVVVAGPAGTNPRQGVMLANLVDTNIMPINVHSLMREIPLINLYNYAMTFDAIVQSMRVPFGPVLLYPYNSHFRHAVGNSLNGRFSSLATTASGKRFLSIFSNNLTSSCYGGWLHPTTSGMALVGPPTGATGTTGAPTAPPLPVGVISRYIGSRLDTKVMHDLIFMTFVQDTIRLQIKTEIELMNARVVTNTAAVGTYISDVKLDKSKVPPVDVTDAMFEM